MKKTLMLLMLLMVTLFPLAQEPATTPEMKDIPEVNALKIENLQLQAEVLTGRMALLRVAIRQNQDQQAKAIAEMWKSVEVQHPENWEVDLASRKARAKKSPPPE